MGAFWQSVRAFDLGNALFDLIEGADRVKLNPERDHMNPRAEGVRVAHPLFQVEGGER